MTSYDVIVISPTMTSIVTFFLRCMVFEITRFYCKPEVTSLWFLRQASLYAISRDGFWQSDHDFLTAFYNNILSAMHGFRDNGVLLQAGNDFIAISSLRGTSVNFWLRILKGRHILYIHVQLTFFVYLGRFRCYSTFCIWLGFPCWGRTFGGFGVKWPPKTSNERKTLSGRSLPWPNCVFWAIVRLTVWPV